MDEAIEWVERLPDYLEREGWLPPSQEEFEVEIRQVYEPAEFGAELTPELREQVTEQDARIRTQASAKLKS